MSPVPFAHQDTRSPPSSPRDVAQQWSEQGKMCLFELLTNLHVNEKSMAMCAVTEERMPKLVAGQERLEYWKTSCWSIIELVL